MEEGDAIWRRSARRAGVKGEGATGESGRSGTRVAAGERERQAERGTRRHLSPVCQPASLVYAPGHPPALQVAIPLFDSPRTKRALDRSVSCDRDEERDRGRPRGSSGSIHVRSADVRRNKGIHVAFRLVPQSDSHRTEIACPFCHSPQSRHRVSVQRATVSNRSPSSVLNWANWVTVDTGETRAVASGRRQIPWQGLRSESENARARIRFPRFALPRSR